MSEVKVNKISPRTACGTVTLGDSGDTFTIPAGATITNNGTAAGFGATGAASWDTTVKTTGFTAVSGVGYFVNTTAGAISVNLPAGTAGDVVAIKDYINTFDLNAVTLVQNGSDKIGGSAINAVLSTEGLAVTLVYVDATQGWLVTDNGTQDTAPTSTFICASVSGACNTLATAPCCANTKIATFTGPGNFTVNSTSSLAPANLVSYLIVAGGAGGAYDRGGAGGAGGFREVKNPVTPYTASPLDGYATPANRITVTAQAYGIVVGAGGAAGTSTPKQPNGSVSSFGGITSAGGGAAGSPGSTSGEPGGSGGGARDIAASGGNGNDPATTPAQGQNGGSSTGNQSGPGGGGGGATQTGFDGQGNPSTPTMGDGGDGATTLISASSTAYAGGGGSGGGGGITAGGEGGTGGGGNGAGNSGPASVAGTANTGGGGGAGNGGGGGFGSGAAGGSGIVIIRYKFKN